MFGASRLGGIWSNAKATLSSSSADTSSKQSTYATRSEILIVSPPTSFQFAVNREAERQQWAYESKSQTAIYGGDNSTLTALDNEIMSFKDDPRYTAYSDENDAYIDSLLQRRTAASNLFGEKEPVRYEERCRRTILQLYGLGTETGKPHGHGLGTAYQLVDLSTTPQSWQRVRELERDQRKATGRRGVDLLKHMASYEARVEAHQILIRAVKQAEKEGLFSREALFPRGRDHDKVAKEVESFDRSLYSEWEASVRGLSQREKCLEFRRFLGRRIEVWADRDSYH
jgi:hypothetical protein